MVSLVPDYGDSSFESSDDSENENTSESTLAQNAMGRLPPPTFSDRVKNSVFLNPYLEAENAKIAVLEKHVKTIPQDENDSSNKLSKVCWMFKKGKCNYGRKCRFSHVINGSTESKTSLEETADENIDAPVSYEEHPLSAGENSDDEGKKKRKKRPGLTRGLIPSKKVIKLYKKHKKEGCGS